MCSVPKTGIFKEWLRSTVEKDRLITLGKAKPSNVVATDVPVPQQHVRVVVKTPGYSREKVLDYAWPSCTEIATTAFLERRYRYEAQ